VGDHYYSDKAPCAAFLGIPVYAGLKLFLDLPVVDRLVERLGSNPAFTATLNPQGSGIFKEKVRFALAQVLLTLLISALPTALAGVLMFRLLGLFTPALFPRLGTVLAYGLLTPAFVYANAFYGHQLSAALLLAAFYILFTARALTPWKSILAGVLLAYSVVSEYPAAVGAGLVFLYGAYRLYCQRRLPNLAWMAAAAALVAAGWMAYNTAVFGGPLSLGYSYSELWLDEHQVGFMSLTTPTWDALWGITFGAFRGLFFYAPVLLLAVAGFGLWWRSGLHRLEWWLAAGISAGILLFNASSVMWWGGFAVGPRYLLPMLPFLCLPLVFVLAAARSRPALFVALALTGLWSLLAVWGLALAGQAYPSDTLKNPLLQYAWPNWSAGNLARNLGTVIGLPGAASLLPLAFALALVWAGWAAARRKSSRLLPAEGE
jgi:hypothetical protein